MLCKLVMCYAKYYQDMILHVYSANLFDLSYKELKYNQFICLISVSNGCVIRIHTI